MGSLMAGWSSPFQDPKHGEIIYIGSREMLQASGALPLRDRKQSILNSSSKSDADILKTNC
ncbi:hypothetical protein BHE74_00027808, partial [Ensete ventricosum]